MKNVSIIGIGIGNLDFTHKKSIDLISNSDCLIGAKRMLSDFTHLNKDTFESSKAEDIYEYISKNNVNKSFGVLVSGDTGFYSLSKS